MKLYRIRQYQEQKAGFEFSCYLKERRVAQQKDVEIGVAHQVIDSEPEGIMFAITPDERESDTRGRFFDALMNQVSQELGRHVRPGRLLPYFIVPRYGCRGYCQTDEQIAKVLDTTSMDEVD